MRPPLTTLYQLRVARTAYAASFWPFRSRRSADFAFAIGSLAVVLAMLSDAVVDPKRTFGAMDRRNANGLFDRGIIDASEMPACSQPPQS
jgi:hypothetical protein